MRFLDTLSFRCPLERLHWNLDLMHLMSSGQCNHSVVSDSLRSHGPQHARPPCPSPAPWVYPNLCPSSQWCHLTISSSVVPFSFRLQSFPASGPFPKSQFFASGGQSIGVSASASVPPMNIQDWFPQLNNREGTQPHPSTENPTIQISTNPDPHFWEL